MHIYIFGLGNTKRRLQEGQQIGELLYGLAVYLESHAAMFNIKSIYWNYHGWRIGYL